MFLFAYVYTDRAIEKYRATAKNLIKMDKEGHYVRKREGVSENSIINWTNKIKEKHFREK